MYEMDKRQKVALFRYGVIAPLVCRKLNETESRKVRQHVLELTYTHPDGSVRRVPERTMRHWLGRYRKFGFKGLFDEVRNDKGTSKVLTEELLSQAELLRKEEPARSVRTVIEILKRSGADTTSLKPRTLARQLTAKGATKKLLKKGAGTYQRWEQLYANDMWHGDTSHGIWLRDPEDSVKAKKTKFIVFVDDASRVCTHGEFYFDEQLPKLLDCFGKALLQRGRPSRLLFDNAFIYHSTSMATVCAEIGSEISFCRPRAPQGKGKVERFIKTVQDSFMVEANRAGVDSLDALNAMFRGWVEQYHNRIHTELEGLTPMERWKQDMHRISLVTHDELKRALMLRAKRKVHMSTATVLVDGRQYQASADLHGQEVEVRWSPNHPESVELWMLGEFIEVASEFHIKAYVEKRERRAEEEDAPGTPTESAKLYVQDLQSVQGEAPLGIIKASELLACGEFVKLVRSALCRKLVQEELDTLGLFYKRLGQLRRDAVVDSFERSIAVKGEDMHLRYYLEQLEQALRRR